MTDRERTAVIVGASRGAAFETARRLACRDFHVIITDPDGLVGKAATDKLQSEGLTVVFHPLDPKRDDSVIRLRQWLAANVGGLDVLVNAAPPQASDDDGHVLRVEADALMDGMAANAFTGLRLIQELIPLMQDGNWGRVINVGASMGRLSQMAADSPAYRLAQSGLYAITAMLGAAVRDSPIRINAVEDAGSTPVADKSPSETSVEEAADNILAAIMVSDDGPSGCLLRNGVPVAWQ